ncbi:MAG TPA: hypothetical protein VF381_07450 [Thermoanaerobaculia bacterium]
MKKALGVCAAVALLSAVGCTSTYQRRGTETPLDDRITVSDLEGVQHVDQQLNLEARSIEQFKTENGKNFDIGVIEINDDGFSNEAQTRQVLDHVRDHGLTEGALIVTFVHGWHHGPRVCDRDICCFRRVLDRIAAARNSKGPVTGIYIGWRGESISAPVLNGFTFWDRKRIAQNNGRMDGAQVLLELDDMYRKARRTNGDDITMVTVGHSFGGALVFSAMKQLVTGSVGDILGQPSLSFEGKHPCGKLSPDDCSYRIVRAEEDRVAAAKGGHKAHRARMGDLVVLVNPAIEASQYQAFDSDLPDTPFPTYWPTDKTKPYADDQLPVLMTVASEADQAVGVAFPIGRFFSGFHDPRIWAHGSLHTGMGHYEPQLTHRLDYTGDVSKLRSDEAALVKSNPVCQCTKNFSASELEIASNNLDLTGTDQWFGKLHFALSANRDPKTWDKHSPYLVVQTTGNVISEHSDIYNPVFVSFLTKYIVAYDKVKTHTSYGPATAENSPVLYGK